MPEFSERSNANLVSCNLQLVTLFREVIRHQDCTVTCGHRNQTDQEEAFRTGHSKAKWGESKHNGYPSQAIDVVPYPIDWEDRERFFHFAGYVKATADQLKISIRWGGDFSGAWDLPHYELTGD